MYSPISTILLTLILIKTLTPEQADKIRKKIGSLPISTSFVELFELIKDDIK